MKASISFCVIILIAFLIGAVCGVWVEYASYNKGYNDSEQWWYTTVMDKRIPVVVMPCDSAVVMIDSVGNSFIRFTLEKR